MKVRVIFLWAICLALALVLSDLEFRSGLSALSVDGTSVVDDVSQDTSVIVALKPAASQLSEAGVRSIAQSLISEPMVAQVSLGPKEPSDTFLRYVWKHRFQISGPKAEAFQTEAMAVQLRQALNVLRRAEGMALGDYLLLDPTGSFARIVKQLDRATGVLRSENGIWLSEDGSTIFMFITLADVPFDIGATAALADQVRTLVRAQGYEAVLMGPRVIAAETAQANVFASSIASIGAVTLLLFWLVFALRSVAVGLVFVPLLLGFGTGLLAVQVAFGSVHVIVLGFGGALLGLALDYPMHIVGHSRTERAGVIRLVLVGAATTALAFVVMLGSGLPVLRQIGVFVSVGLIAAAAATILMPMPSVVRIHVPSVARLFWRLPRKAWIETAIIMLCLGFVIVQHGPAQTDLFSPPPQVQTDIDAMNALMPLPSGRYALQVHGSTLANLLAVETQLAGDLDAAINQNDLDGYVMLAQVLDGPQPDLPLKVEYATRVSAALEQVGLDPDFAEYQTAAYAKALAAKDITLADLETFEELSALTARLRQTKDGWQEVVPLFLAEDKMPPTGLARQSGVELIDRVASIQSLLTGFQKQIVQWLTLGFCLAVFLMAAGLRNWVRAFIIARTTLASVLVTAALLVAVYGALSLFHIVALALVMGIGVDYGLFVGAMRDKQNREGTGGTVALCATSTFIAFFVMLFSQVQILQQIGSAVFIGLTVTMVLTLAHSEKRRAE